MTLRYDLSSTKLMFKNLIVKLQYNSKKESPQNKTVSNTHNGSGKMSQWIKAIASKPDDLSSIPRAHIKVKGKAFKPSTQEAEAGGSL